MLADSPDLGLKNPVKLSFLYDDFSGGMCRNIDPSGIEDNEYALLINGRNRYGNLAPIKGLTERSTEIPAGKYQAIFGFDSIMLVFISGVPFVRDFAQVGSVFQQVPGVFLSETVDEIFAAAVPSSWMNLQRKLEDGETTSSQLAFYSEVFGTPAAIVCQDGISRPYLIFSSGQARLAKNFAEWSNDELDGIDKREYVPVGKQMLYSPEGILYTISADGTEIYRSVTGRPLDYVVAIDSNGDKLTPLSSGKEEASRTSYKIDFSKITCLAEVGAPPRIAEEGQGFFVSTRKKSWLVFPNFGSTIFGEPTFSNQGLFPTGGVNNNSIIDILGDKALTTETGITSFNSVLAVSNEGKNAPFHDKIFKLFELGQDQIIQTTTASISSDNYGFMAVDTVYGPAILVYDALRRQHTAIDIYPEVSGKIKQFAEVKVNGQRFLYFITTGNQMFEMFSGEIQTMKVYLKEVTSPETAEKEILPRRARVVLNNAVSGGTITITPYVDSKAGTPVSRTYEAATSVNTIPIAPPFGANTADDIDNKTFDFSQQNIGNIAGLYIELTGSAEIDRVEFVCETKERKVSQQDAAQIFAEIKGTL